MLDNAAVFLSNARHFKGVNVDETDGEIVVLNRVNETPMARFQIVEVVKAGEAWDVLDPINDERVRLVAQLGCGCSGMRPYQPDASYSGALR